MAGDAIDGAHTNDVLSDALRSLHITGTLLLREAYAAPWAVAIPDATALHGLLALKRGTRAVAFHLVEFGHCEVRTSDGATHVLQAGEMAITFGGRDHQIGEGKPSHVQSVQHLLGGQPNVQKPEVTGQPVAASLMCGVFLLQHTAFNPLVAALPAVVRASLSRPGQLSNLSGIARLMVEELGRTGIGGAQAGSGFVVERLLEVLCAQAIRAHLQDAPRTQAGWVRAIHDPVVGRAMALVHAQPGGDWSVRRLASAVAMSPSRFAARFSDTLGDSPMAYVSKLRMDSACKLLVNTHATVDQIATDVGYESAAAFNRAFKAHVGLAPGFWRTQEAAALAA